MLTLLELGKGRVPWQNYSLSIVGQTKCSTEPNYKPMDEDMAHQTILIILFCQAFKLGQDLSLKHLNSRLLIPLLKCLQINLSNN